MKKNLLNPVRKKVVPGISLVTAVKNRKKSLSEVLKTWVACEEIDEIIIVDWSSDESLEKVIKKFKDDRIFLAVVPGQEKWILSYACNLGFRLASRDKIFKTDADVKVMPGFFSEHLLAPGRFFSGNWQLGRDDNEKHLNGSVYLYRDDFFAVNGYNEYIKFYGWDDSDLYARLEGTGLVRHDFNLDTLYHIPHEARTLLQDTASGFRNLSDLEKSNLNTLTNRHLCNALLHWSPQHKMTGFQVTEKEQGIWNCIPAGEDPNPVPKDYYLISETEAIKERLKQFGFGIPDEIAGLLAREEIVEYYNLFLSRDTDRIAASLFDLISKYNYLYSANIDNKISEINQLNEKLEKGDHERSGSGKELRRSLAMVEKLKTELHESQVGRETLKGDLHQKEVTIQHLNGLVHQAQAEVQKLRDELHDSKVAALKLRSDLNKEQVGINELRDAHHRLRVSLEESRTRMHAQAVEIEQLKGALHQSLTETEKLKGSAHAGRVELQQILTVLHERDVNIQELLGELGQHRSAVAEMTRKWQETEGVATSLQNELAYFRQLSGVQQETIESLHRIIADKEAMIIGKDNEIASANKEIRAREDLLRQEIVHSGDLADEIARLKESLAVAEKSLQDTADRLAEREDELIRTKDQLRAILDSFSWKLGSMLVSPAKLLTGKRKR